MYKSILTGLTGAILFGVSMVSAQKPTIVVAPDYNFDFVTSYVLEGNSLDIHDFVNPYYSKDTLTGIRALEFAVANELGLKHLFWTDGHIHGTGLAITIQIARDGQLKSLDGAAREEKLARRLQKLKGETVIIEMADEDKGKIVWTGWISLSKLKSKTELAKLQAAARLLITQYPPSK